MKKHALLALLAAVVSSCPLRPAFAAITAEVTFRERELGIETRLYAEILLAGIADCPKNGSVTVTFTSPDESKIQSSDFEAPWRSCREKGGIAHTRAYRTITLRGHRITGTWKVKVSSGKTTLAESSYTVKE